MAEELTVAELLRSIVRHWVLALAVAFAVFVGAVLYAESLPNEYEAKVVVSFAPRPGQNVGADTVRVILPKYVSYVTAEATLNRVAPRVGLRQSAVRSAVDASIGLDSGNLTIKARLRSPRNAAAVANALADEALSIVATDPLLDAVVASPALPPRSPAGPPRRLMEAAALVVGGLLGALVALGVERRRPRLRTAQEMALVTGYPVVGRIPVSRHLRASVQEALGDLATGAAVRTLRTNLERTSRDMPVRVLMVTSAISGEGKTTVAALLSVALARLEARVLLIDGDLHRPGVARVFEVPDRRGLADVLHERVTLDQAVHPGPARGLWLLTTTADTNAGDLLARSFADVLRASREQFDVIVVDTPPLLGPDAARAVATMCDAVLLVVAGDTLAGSAGEAAAALAGLQVRVMGVAANKLHEPRHLAYSESYAAYGARS